MMIVMVIVMRPPMRARSGMNFIAGFRRGMRSLGRGIFVGLDQGRTRSRRCITARWRRLGAQRNPAGTAELVAFAIPVSAHPASRVKISAALERAIFRRRFGIGFHGEALHGLQSRGNRLLIRLGPPHLRIQPLIDLAQRRIVRPNTRHAFRIRLVSVYFSLLVIWRIAGSMMSGHDLRYAVVSAASCVILGASGVVLFCFFAWLIARTTTYTITQKRVVLTYGMALPKSLNLPFTAIEAADMRINADGSGDIAFRLPTGKRLSYLLLWPHVRAGTQGRAQPVLRCVLAPQEAAEILSQALSVAIATPASAPQKTTLAHAA